MRFAVSTKIVAVAKSIVFPFDALVRVSSNDYKYRA